MRIRRHIAGLLAALVVGAVGATAVATPASAASLGPFRIVHNSGFCLEVPEGNYGWYTQLRLAPCHSYAYQQFTLVETGVPWQFYIQTYHWYCLDVGSWSTAPDARIVQWPCSWTPNQRFQAISVNAYEWKLQAEHSGYCMRVHYPGLGQGTVQGYCNDTNALWRFR